MKATMLFSMLLLVATGSEKATAAVTETRENAFTIEATVMADATPASYRDLIRVNLWWDPAHTWSGSAGNLKLDARG